jgi:hypothetical protein
MNKNLTPDLDENSSNDVNNYIGNKPDTSLSKPGDTLGSKFPVFPSE